MALTNLSESNTLRVASALGYLGVLPFALCAAVLAESATLGAGAQAAALFGFYVPYVFVSYSAVILSFVCGALWGGVNGQQVTRTAAHILLFSNIVSLSAWFSLLLTHVSHFMTLVSVGLLAMGFVAVLFVERTVVNSDGGYWRLRRNLTMVVVLLHLFVLFVIAMESL
jgi:hypothetical protein